MQPLKFQRLFLLRRIFSEKVPFRNCSTPASSSNDPREIKLNKGRLDWLFADGYRRPLAEDQGGKMRKDWICFGFHPTNEHKDWAKWHYYLFMFFTFVIPATSMILWYFPDWPRLSEWGWREAYMEIERREKAGLPLISKDYIDPKVMLTHLPSEEELGEFKIII